MPKHRSTAKLVENVRTLVDNSRTHTIICDLPTAKGGDDTGPTALELAIMAFSDCAATTRARAHSPKQPSPKGSYPVFLGKRLALEA